VNWRTFYDLPKVKPVRIRVGGNSRTNSLTTSIRSPNPTLSTSKYTLRWWFMLLSIVTEMSRSSNR
jgi:hypothetical protein